MQISNANINQLGQIIGFRVHDSRLTEFTCRNRDSLILRAVRDDNAEITIRCLGVSIVGTVKFRFPDTIAEMFAWHPEEAPEGTRTLVDGAWNVLFTQDVQSKDLSKAIRDALAKHRAKYLFHVICEGMISALCDDIFVEVTSPAARSE